MLDKIGNFLGLAPNGSPARSSAGTSGESDFAEYYQKNAQAHGPAEQDAATDGQVHASESTRDAEEAGRTEGDGEVEDVKTGTDDPDRSKDAATAGRDSALESLEDARHESESSTLMAPGSNEPSVRETRRRMAAESGLSASRMRSPDTTVPEGRAAAQGTSPGTSPTASGAEQFKPDQPIEIRVPSMRHAANGEGSVAVSQDGASTGAARLSGTDTLATQPEGTEALLRRVTNGPDLAQSNRARITDTEFAVQRAALQAEKRAQLTAQASEPGAKAQPPVEPNTARGPSEAQMAAAVRSVVKDGDPGFGRGRVQGEQVAENAQGVPVKVVPTPANASTTASVMGAGAGVFASQGVRGAATVGVTHPSILDAAEEAEALEMAASSAGGTETRQAQSVTTGMPAGRNDAAQVVRQLVEAMPRAGNGSVEIRLSPEELGHVRMQLSQSDAGLIVHIQADRAETLDLLRRHVDQLARDLSQSGHDAAGFTFSEDGQRERDGREAGDSLKDVGNAATDEPAAEPARLATDQTGLDIKI